MTKSRHVVYLAGGMEKAGSYGAVWREELTPYLRNLGYTVWNPYKEELNVGIGVESLAELKRNNYHKFLSYCKKIVDFDIKALLSCQIVACRIDQSVLAGAGTYGELTMCRFYGIPVYTWIDLPNNEYDVPSWAMGCLTDYAFTKEDFYKLIPSAAERENKSSQEWKKHMDDYINEWSKEFSDL